jgi:general secretion pathway protein J
VTRSSARGFTLMEIALAVSIIAIMGTLTWGSLSQSFDAYETVKDIDQRYHNVRVAMNRMSREISMAFLTQPGRDFGREPMWKTVFVGKAGSDYAELQFTSFAHVVLREDAKESDQSEIGYTVERDEENREQRNLVRREDPRIDREPEKGGTIAVLSEGVKKLKFRYFDPKDDDWTDEWNTEKPEQLNRLPTIVEITLVVEDEGGKDLTFVTKTRINMPTALPKF